MRRTVTAAVLLLTVVTSSSAYAADPHFYLGFTGVQSQDSYRYADVQIGSDETDSTAKGWIIWVTLTVKKDGATVCSASVEKAARVRPPIRPLRFQVFYPPLTLRDGIPQRAVNVTYRMHSKLEVRDPADSRLIMSTTNALDQVFLSNGTPSCVQN